MKWGPPKIFTTAMAFDAGTATMRSSYDATNPIRIARFTIRDFEQRTVGSLSLKFFYIRPILAA